MTKTTDELVNQTLRNFGIVPQGGKTYDAVERAALTMYETLKQREVVNIINTAQIPDEWFLPLSDLLADTVKGEFKRSEDQSLPLRATQAVADLRAMRRGI